MTTKYTARTGNRGHGLTHLHSTTPQPVRIHGMIYVTTGKALCGSLSSATAVEVEADAMPADAAKPCAKCIAKAAQQ